MATFAVIDEAKIINIIVAENKETAELATGLICIEYTEENLAGIGWTYQDGKFIAPPQPIIEEEIKSVN